MLPEWRRLIETIHDTPLQCVVVVTGGGASAIADLLAVPGGSRTIVEAVVPYSAKALSEWLGRSPEHFCSRETVLAMAAVACERARRFATSSTGPGAGAAPRLVGLACTAALVSDRPKRGEHRIHVAAQTDDSTSSRHLELEKGARDRSGEEALAGQLLLTALAQAANIGAVPGLELRAGERIVEESVAGDPLVVALRKGQASRVWSLPDGRLTDDLPAAGSGDSPFPRPRGVLSGAFNPLHYGHEALRGAAEQHLAGPVYYELSLRNVDKPPLDFLTIDERRRQFKTEPLALTSAPTFAEKSAALPGTTFVVGVDTAERIIHPRYYGNSEAGMREALSKVAENGGRFLVAGRQVADRYLTLANLQLPAGFQQLFEELSESEFRADVSSTELRKLPGC